MDTLRLILPAVLPVILGLLLTWILALIIRKHCEKEHKKITIKIALFITICIFIFSSLWITRLLSVNVIPRSEIDRSLPADMKERFETRMKNDTTKNH